MARFRTKNNVAWLLITMLVFSSLALGAPGSRFGNEGLNGKAYNKRRPKHDARRKESTSKVDTSSEFANSKSTGGAWAPLTTAQLRQYSDHSLRRSNYYLSDIKCPSPVDTISQPTGLPQHLAGDSDNASEDRTFDFDEEHDRTLPDSELFMDKSSLKSGVQRYTKLLPPFVDEGPARESLAPAAKLDSHDAELSKMGFALNRVKDENSEDATLVSATAHQLSLTPKVPPPKVDQNFILLEPSAKTKCRSYAVGSEMLIKWGDNPDPTHKSLARVQNKYEIWYRPTNPSNYKSRERQGYELVATLANPSAKEYKWKIPILPDGYYELELNADGYHSWSQNATDNVTASAPQKSREFRLFNSGTFYDGPAPANFGPLGNGAAHHGSSYLAIAALIFTVVNIYE